MIGTVAAGKEVQLHGCKSWCEITYAGKRGFVYKRFVRGAGGGAVKSSAAKPVKADPAKPEKPKVVAAQGLPGVEMTGIR